MSLYDIVHGIFGEYVFSVDEVRFPRLANLLNSKNIAFWGIENAEGRVIFKTSIFVAEAVEELSKKAILGAEIIDKRGLPFVFSRYRKRYGLIIGAFFGLFLLFYSELFVWKIEIKGNIEVSEREILANLRECGISVGAFIPDIAVDERENRLLMVSDKISSAAIGINGTHLTLSVIENREAPEIVNTDGFYNVVAARDGVVLDVDAADGGPEVSVGDSVYKGELLINSFLEGTNGSFTPTHARGNVYAAVKEKIVIKIPISRLTKNHSGRTDKKTIFNILGIEILPFGGLEPDYEYFDAMTIENNIKLFGFIELPIVKTEIIYSEYFESEELITASLAELFAREELSDRLDDFGCEVLECETKVRYDEKIGACILTADAVLKQNIAKEIPLEILSYNISAILPNAWE